MQNETSAGIARPDSRRFTLATSLILLPIIVFYALLARHMINMPYMDDYNGVLQFLEHLSSLPNVPSKIGYIVFAQHNEYKTVFANFVIAVQYGISGHPNFILLSWLGDLFVLVLFYLMWRHFLANEENTSRRLLLFTPVAYLLFQFQYVETLNWSSPGLQNIPVLIFAFASLAALARASARSFFLACVLMVLAIASSGNGFALLPVGIAMLLQRRAWGRVGLWVLVVCSCAGLYFYHYNFHLSQQDPNGSVLRSAHYLNPIFALAFMGSALSLHVHLIQNISILSGLFISVLILLMVKRRFDKSNPVVFYFSVFLTLTAIGVSGIRSKFGLDASLAGRYRIYSDLLLICCYVFIMESYLRKRSLQDKFFQVALVVSILFWAIFDRSGERYLVARENGIIVGAKAYEVSHHEQGPILSNSNEGLTMTLNHMMRPIMEDSESTGLYRFP
ncbi:MAG TPA: hypothetical protein VGG80_05200 [Acidobacteriaceae bacterium]